MRALGAFVPPWLAQNCACELDRDEERSRSWPRKPVQRLRDRIDLIVVETKGEGQQLRFEIVEPRSVPRQMHGTGHLYDRRSYTAAIKIPDRDLDSVSPPSHLPNV